MGIDLKNCYFKASGHTAFILHISILNSSALSINAIYELQLQCSENSHANAGRFMVVIPWEVTDFGELL